MVNGLWYGLLKIHMASSNKMSLSSTISCAQSRAYWSLSLISRTVAPVVATCDLVVAYTILETAQSPNSSFPFLFDFGLWNWTRACQLHLYQA